MNILQLIRNTFNLNGCESEIEEYNYYNGSENELKNILLELVKHSRIPVNVFNQEAYRDKISFLASEGLTILDIYDVVPKSFKFTKQEIDTLIAGKKKTTKKSVKTNKKVKK